MPTPLIYAHGGRDSGDVVGAYAFSATLAIQDITGSPYSGVSAAHMAKRLEGSSESEALLFAVTDLQAPRPLGPLGYPEVRVDDLTEIAAWVFISLPLLEDTRVIEATVTLDATIAPLPGEPVPCEPWVAALSLIDALSASLSRPIRQVWVTHSGEPLTEPELSLTSHGYSAAYHETQAMFSLDAVAPAAPDPGISVVRNMSFAPDDLPSLRALLSKSSRDYPRGDLILDSIDWTEQRLREASARLMDRGGTQLTAVAHAPDGEVIGMAEAVHYDSDDDRLMELGLIYVLPEHRDRGAAQLMLNGLIAAAKTEWPKIETVYASYPADSEPAARLLRPLSPKIISSATAWQKHVRKS